MDTDVGQSLIGCHGDMLVSPSEVVMETDVGQSLIGRHGDRRWSVSHRSSWRQTLVSPSQVVMETDVGQVPDVR